MFKNTVNLAQNDEDAFVVAMPRTSQKNVTVGITVDPSSHASAEVRLDASWDHGTTWIESISLSNPTATIGAAFVTTIGNGEVGQTQDRVFGATHVRVVRTDANGGVCLVSLTQTLN